MISSRAAPCAGASAIGKRVGSFLQLPQQHLKLAQTLESEAPLQRAIDELRAWRVRCDESRALASEDHGRSAQVGCDRPALDEPAGFEVGQYPRNARRQQAGQR